MIRQLPFLLSVFAVLAQSQPYAVVDVQRVPAEGDPRVAIRTIPASTAPARDIACDFLIAGAGAGGFAAALQAAQRGHSVCLTEETDWIGGQLTAGGVSALDEHRFIEITGGTRSYYDLRERIRNYYRQRYQLAPAAAALENLNPGSCYVSALCFEPKAALTALQDMMKPYRINLLLRTRVLALDVQKERIESALAYGFDTNELIRIRPRWVLDATETGELLPLARVPYVVGSEAQSETQEPHASTAANPACVQSFTYPFAIEPRPGEQHRIAKPTGYERIRDSQPFSVRIVYPEEFGWKGAVQYTMFGDLPPVPNNMSPGPFFGWRRLLDSRNFTGPGAPHDLALINWPKQDYHTESLLDRTPEDTARILQEAKRVSVAFLYWLQNDLARDDRPGQRGYPELMLRPDVMGTADGLSKYPYIRESRRLRAQGRVVEQDIVIDDPKVARARWFADSIGTGFYMVDIHPCGANERGRMMMPKPFQVPLSTLVPRGVSNLLAAGKSLGVTHLANGAFRLHPIEWNIGEAAAIAGSLAMQTGHFPTAAEVQPELVRAGISLVWFDDLPVSHPSFTAIQLTATQGVYPLNESDLHASPEAPVTRAEAAVALAAYFHQHTTREKDLELAVREGWMAVDHRNWFHPDLPFYWTDWREAKMPAPLPPHMMKRTGPVRRSELAERLARR